MRGLLIIIAGGATLAVAGLAFAATAAFAAPMQSSASAVDHPPSLVIPPNYHPSSVGAGAVNLSADGLITVSPRPAVDIVHPVLAPPAPSDNGDNSHAATPPGAAVPPTTRGKGSSKGQGSSHGQDSRGDNSSSNSGNDVNNKGTGSTKSNNGNDLGNKGTGSNKTKNSGTSGG